MAGAEEKAVSLTTDGMGHSEVQGRLGIEQRRLAGAMSENAKTASDRGIEIEWKCPVCPGRRGRVDTLDKVLRVDGEFVMVYGIPATVCVYCGEETFSDEDIEWVRVMLNGNGQKYAKRVTLDAYEFPG